MAIHDSHYPMDRQDAIPQTLVVKLDIIIIAESPSVIQLA